MKKRNFKQDLFMVGLGLGVIASTAITGHFFKKGLEKNRMEMIAREEGYLEETDDRAELRRRNHYPETLEYIEK